MRLPTAAGGFTLVELICTMIILGVLAAAAAPKLLDMRANAREAVLQAYAGSLKGAVGQVRAKWRASNGAGSVQMSDGTSVQVLPATGYPTLDPAGIGMLMQCNQSLCDDMRVDYSPVLTLFTPVNARVGRCTVFYWPNELVATIDATGCSR